VDVADQFGLRQDEQVVVAPQRMGMVGKARAAEVFFREAMALDHRAHRPVEDQNPLLK